MNNPFRHRIRLVALVALVVSVVAHLTGGLRADATGLFTYSFNIGELTRGGAPGQFVYPSGLAVGGPQNQIYVADTQNNRVQVFTANGAHVHTFGGHGSANGQFDYPTGIAVDAAGNILVADNFNHRIQIFDANFNYVSTFGVFGNYDVLDPTHTTPSTLSGLNYPTRVTLRAGTQLGVANSGVIAISDSMNHRIIVLDSMMTPLFEFGVAGTDGNGPGEFDYPVGLGIDASRIYVTDPGNHQIQIFTYNLAAKTATLEGSFGSLGATHEVGDLAQPYDVHPDGQGRLVVTDRDHHRVLYLTPDPLTSLTPLCSDTDAADLAGRCAIVSTDAAQTRYDALVIGGFTGSGTDKGKFSFPESARIDAQGRLVVLDTIGSRVVVFRPAHLTVQPVTVTPAGPVQSGQSVSMNVMVVNDGAAPLTVTPTVTASLAGTLSLPAARFMNPGDSQSFLVTFVTNATGALSFTVSASGQPAAGRAITAAPVTAAPIVTVDPAPEPKMSLSMTSSPSLVGMGKSAQVSLTVSNTGSSELLTVTPSVAVAPSELVSFATMTASSTGPLAVGSSRIFTFNYTTATLPAGTIKATATFTGSASATYSIPPSSTGTISTLAGTGPTTSLTVTSDDAPPQTSVSSVTPAGVGNACSLESGAATSGWHLGPVTVTLTAVDNTAVKSILYAATGLVPFSGAPNASTTTFDVKYDGKTKLTYHAVDTAGNVEANHELVFCIDSVAPTIEKGGVTPAPNDAGWHNTPPTVTFVSKDDTSGQAFLTPPTTVSTNGAGQVVTGLARDGAGNTATTTVTVNVDTVKPAFTCSAGGPIVWPPAHKMVEWKPVISVSDATSGLGTSTFKLVDFYSSEPDNGKGDGNTQPDMSGWDLEKPDTVGFVRVERSGTGIGRTYTLVYMATDLAGNTGQCSVSLTVPHDQSKK